MSRVFFFMNEGQAMCPLGMQPDLLSTKKPGGLQARPTLLLHRDLNNGCIHPLFVAHDDQLHGI